MKQLRFINFIFLFFPQILFAQFTDNFSDSNFTQNPSWGGNVNLFTVNSNKQLQSIGPPLTADIYISTPNNLLENTEWNFFVQLNFKPSSTNNAKIYLASDQENLLGSLNGYYIKIGDKGTKHSIDLYRQTGINSVKILSGVTGHVDFFPAIRIKVTLDFEGTWTILSDILSGKNFTQEASVTDFIHIDPKYFGVVCSFSPSNSQGFIFDDFEVKQSGFLPIVPISYKDVIFSEILSHEHPGVDLPEAKYFELYNRTGTDINLQNFIFSNHSKYTVFPKYLFKSHTYLIVCKDADTSLFKTYGQIVGLNNFPKFLISEDQLTIRDKKGKLIDDVNYNIEWYKNIDKSKGGWSLEIIDENNICAEESNWAASENPSGGTPGKVNSIKASNPDLTPPQINLITVENTKKIICRFNKKIDSTVFNINSFKIDKSQISAIKVLGPDFKSLEINFSPDLMVHSVYQLTSNSIKDYCGNISGTATTNFAIPEQGDSNDVIINEILFHPKKGSVHFVEIYNRSDKYINLKNWKLGSINSHGIVDTVLITEGALVLFPKSYLLITIDENDVKTNYPRSHTDRFLLLKKIPSYNHDDGTVLIYNNFKKLIDRFDYSETFQSKLLISKEGVSLERINPEGFGNTSENWHSAASVEGFATPGYKNSQMLISNSEKSPLSIEPKIFSPDGDGLIDFTTINYFANTSGNVANIIIFDVQGREIKKIAQNQSLSTEGMFQWDGTNANGEKVRTGTYIVYCQIFNLNGNVNEFKETVIVGGKF